MPTKSSKETKVDEVSGGWSLVTHGDWQVSVGPDGLIQLPRHLAPSEVPDFVAACQRAAEVGEETIKKNAEARSRTRPGVTSTLVVSDSGDTPPGAMKITGLHDAAHFSAIGRRGGR